jgi:hypothetical protein
MVGSVETRWRVAMAQTTTPPDGTRVVALLAAKAIPRPVVLAFLVGLLIGGVISANWYDYQFSGDPTIVNQGWEPIPGGPSRNGIAFYYRRPRLRLP